jgi:sulfate permease, SulP family
MRLDIDLNDAAPAPAASGFALRQDISGALDGLAAAIPIALCGVAIVYVNFPAAYLSPGVFATLLALALMHAVSAAGGRPMVFSARLFEATTLSAMLGQFVKLAPAWGLVATPQVLLALLCVVGTMAAIVCGLLFVLRADRFTRMIPAPVYAGFAISISMLLLISQSRALWQLWNTGHSAAMLTSVCVVAIGVNVTVRHIRPRWPASAIGLIAAAVVALLWLAAGAKVAMVMQPGQPLALPWAQADFAALLAPTTAKGVLLQSLIYNATLLGLILFVNMTVANEIVSQGDDRHASRWMHAALSMVGAAGAAVGSVPVAGSQQAAAAMLRTSSLSPRKVLMVGIGVLVVAGSGGLHWIALAAVAGVMLCDSFYMADRPSIKEAWRWLRGADLPRSKLEDLTLVLAVTVAAVAFNAAVAIFVGLLLGLLMFAVRNAKQPVRHLWTGEQLHSNCARGARELGLLTQHGQSIRVIELESELFFGAIASLDESLTASLPGAHTVIADWTRVRHVDSSIALAVARWMRAAKAAKVQVLHAGAGHEAGNQASGQGSNALEFLNQYFGQAVLLSDLDRALEAAENALIGELSGERSHQTTVMHEQIALFDGLTATQLKQMQASMRERLYQVGEVIFNAGEVSDSMLVILQGRASVMVSAGSASVRLTSMRRGGVVGEMGFLDRAPRSATVIAEEPLLAYVLTREAFDDLREKWPETAYILIKNLTLNLAVRLRHTNRLAMARSAVA